MADTDLFAFPGSWWLGILSAPISLDSQTKDEQSISGSDKPSFLEVQTQMRKTTTRLVALLRQGRLPNFAFHLNRARDTWKARATRTMDMVTVVSPRPAVLLCGAHPSKLLRFLQPPLRDLPMTIFYRAGWSLEHEATFEDRVRAIKAAQSGFPRHHYIFAVNTPNEAERVRRAGIRAEFLNENAFIDEFAFKPDGSVVADHDAILDAQVAPYKRLELAAKVRRLLVVTFVMKERFNATYGDQVQKSLAHATWANGPFWEPAYRKLSREEVAACYRRARVGLSLSAMEGANLASIQYLLSGLAVVSTESSGGRDIFFSPEYTRIVPPDAKAVADAVNDLMPNAPSPVEIRERTLAKIWPIRDRFADILVRECGHAPLTPAWWKEFNTNRRIRYLDLVKVARSVAEANSR